MSLAMQSILMCLLVFAIGLGLGWFLWNDDSQQA
jgi:hypothetical protein